MGSITRSPRADWGVVEGDVFGGHAWGDLFGLAERTVGHHQGLCEDVAGAFKFEYYVGGYFSWVLFGQISGIMWVVSIVCFTFLVCFTVCFLELYEADGPEKVGTGPEHKLRCKHRMLAVANWISPVFSPSFVM